VTGASERTLEVVEPAAGLLTRTKTPDAPLLAALDGAALSVATLASELLYAAHDAGIDRPGEVTPDALWHTGAAFLARQGIRLADLAKVVGRLSPEQAAAFSALAPAGKRLALDEVERVIPGIHVADVA
jgi:hypothetical protein